MDFKMNPDFPRHLQQQMSKFNAALKAVYDGHAGEEVSTVRAVLRRRVAAVGNGAQITEPDLTKVATQISRGKKVWMESNGKIMADD